MKKIIASGFLLFALHASSQTMGEIVSVNAGIIPKSKRVTTVVSGRTQFYYVDTAYTMVVTIKTNNLQVGEKLVLKVGLTQNDTLALNEKFKVLDKPNNGRTINRDFTPYVEMDEVKSGYVNLYFDFPKADLQKVKWLTTFVKNDGVNSEKKYYEIK